MLWSFIGSSLSKWRMGAVDNPLMPLSAKEKQAAYRQRQAEQGLQEVRGIYLPPAMHAELKKIARKLLEQARP